jgi:hypothetical protein
MRLVPKRRLLGRYNWLESMRKVKGRIGKPTVYDL